MRDLYQKRVSDVRFLIPVLNGLTKEEVKVALPKLIKLNPVVVREVSKLIKLNPVVVRKVSKLIKLNPVVVREVSRERDSKMRKGRRNKRGVLFTKPYVGIANDSPSAP